MDNRVDIGIPPGKYEISVGDSFNNRPTTEFHTLKLDFKPKSVATEQEAYIATNEKGDVQMVVPNETTEWSIYQGNSKPIKNDKELILVYDKSTNKLRLEKLNSNIVVKKTRGKLEEKVDETVRQEIMLRHNKRVEEREAARRERRSTTESENNGSSDGSSDSDSDSDSDKSEDERQQSDRVENDSDAQENNQSDDDALLESRSYTPSDTNPPVAGPHLPKSPFASALERHLAVHKEDYKPIVTHSKPITSTVQEDLQLSESDSSDEE